MNVGNFFQYKIIYDEIRLIFDIFSYSIRKQKKQELQRIDPKSFLKLEIL